MMGWIGCEHLDMDWKWVRESLHMVWGGFKMRWNELNMIGSGWKRARNRRGDLKMSRSR